MINIVQSVTIISYFAVIMSKQAYKLNFYFFVSTQFITFCGHTIVKSVKESTIMETVITPFILFPVQKHTLTISNGGTPIQ